MSVPVEELTKNDYKVLEYINRFTSVHKNDIEKHLNNSITSLDYVLSKLSKVDYKLNGDVPFPIANSNYIEEEFDRPTNDYETPRKSLNMFHITDIGRDVLQNYHIKQRVAKKELWLKNALIPVITVLGPLAAGLLTGSLVVEKVFAVPGIGDLLVNAINTNDLFIISGVAIIYSAFYITVILIVDVLYGVIDPRIRLAGGN